MSAPFDEARLSVLLDVRHPYSYLALAPTCALARDLNTEINWLPIVGKPLHAPSPPDADDDRGVRHRRYRGEAIAREIHVYAAAQGLEILDYYRAPDPGAFNLAWLWVREAYPSLLDPFLQQAFGAYWSRNLDPSSRDDLRPLIDAIGASGRDFSAWIDDGVGPSRAAALEDGIEARGLSGTQCFLVDDEVFYGRQHLAMIRWILNGREGHGPI